MSIRFHGNGVLPRYAEDIVVKPDSAGALSFETTIPSFFQVGDLVTFSGLIGNGSGARANFMFTAGDICPITFIGMHGIIEDHNSETIRSAIDEFKHKIEGYNEALADPSKKILATYTSIPYPTVAVADLVNLLDPTRGASAGYIKEHTKYLNDAASAADRVYGWRTRRVDH